MREPHTAIDPTEEWFEDAMATQRELVRREVMRFVHEFCAEFMDVGGNTKVQLYALILVTGMGKLFNIRSQEHAARLCKVGRANISHYCKRWQKRLGVVNSEFCRDKETEQRCRAARRRVLCGGGEHRNSMFGSD